MSFLAANTYLPWWLVVPAAALVMLVVAAHVLSIQHGGVPASRRRIRTANGLLMLVTVPLFAYAVTVPHGQAPQFALVWVAVMALLLMVIMLALLDIVNNIRLSSLQRRDLSKAAAQALVEQVEERRQQGGTHKGRGEGAENDRAEETDAR